jgi:RNA polymerase sigma-70 factor (ECF subfamily)
MADLGDASDEDLLRLISAGDEDAFRALFRRYAPTALALARRIVRQQTLAEEVMQEVFLSLWREGDRFDTRRGSARAWVMGMVHKRAVDAVRREEAQRRRADDAALPEAMEDPAEEIVEAIDLPRERRAVRIALGSLPPDQRQVIELMYFDGLSQSRIAERLSLPLGTVKSRARLAMGRLRDSLLGDRA